MARNPDLPKPAKTVISKSKLLEKLLAVDNDDLSRKRVLDMESLFRASVGGHVTSLPDKSALFRKFNTSPYVLLFYARQRGYRHVHEIEEDILPSKLFSSMETSAGRMVQDVVLPIYGWELVQSSMHSSGSVLDGIRRERGALKALTLKSGPRCLNDEMSKDLANDIVENVEQWADEYEADHIGFTYAALYGTKKQSNKKDWHILRNIADIVGPRNVLEHPRDKWACSIRLRKIRLDVEVRIGEEWWNYLGGPLALTEVITALIRACVDPAPVGHARREHIIKDLDEIVSAERVPENYNVGLLQRSQLEWLFFIAYHYCDELVD